MRVGKYDVYTLETGCYLHDGGGVFGVIPKVLWSKQVSSDEKNRVLLSIRCLLIVGEGRKILVDTGIGDRLSEKLKKIYGIDTEKANLNIALESLGCNADDITDVVFTHLHFDHTGGALKSTDGRLEPAFPNAIYYVQKRNYEWALFPCEIDRVSYIKENFLWLNEIGKLQLLEGEKEIFPGIRILLSDGHTPGQQLLLIEDDARPLLFCGDVFPMSNHLPVTWISSFDLYPVSLIEEKKRFLSKAAEENWLIVFPHDPVVKAATVEHGDKHFRIKEIVEI